MWKVDSCCSVLHNNCSQKTQTFLAFTLADLRVLIYLRTWFWNRMPNCKMEKPRPLQLLTDQTCNDCIFKVMLMIIPCVVYQRLAVCQYRKKILFLILESCTQNSFWPQENCKENESFRKIQNAILGHGYCCCWKTGNRKYLCRVFATSSILVWFNSRSKGKTTKDSKDTIGAFPLMITKSQPLKRYMLRNEQILLESSKNFVRLKENNFTLPWVKPRLHSLNVLYDLKKQSFIVTWKTMDTSTIGGCCILSHCLILEKTCLVDLRRKYINFFDFLPIVYNKPLPE